MSPGHPCDLPIGLDGAGTNTTATYDSGLTRDRVASADEVMEAETGTADAEGSMCVPVLYNDAEAVLLVLMDAVQASVSSRHMPPSVC